MPGQSKKTSPQNTFLPILLAVGLTLIASYFIFHKSPQTRTANQNFNSISDSSLGVSFNMSKDFEPISRDALTALNPGFSYGFRPANDPNVLCVVSQTKLAGAGTIKASQLRDGILAEIKKIHPDVALDNPAMATKWAQFGQGQGVLLQLTYSDGSAKIKRVEVIALGKTQAVQVIAYCQSLATDSAKYYNDFTVFFSSLKVQ